MENSKKYYIHDNGGRPFEVIVDYNKKKVTINDSCERVYKYWNSFDFSKIWIGFGCSYLPGIDKDDGEWTTGNTILFQKTSGELVVIGWKIQEFKLPDDEYVVWFDSPVGNSDVPYPSIVTNKATYLTIEYTRLPNNLIHIEPNSDKKFLNNVYDFYYFDEEFQKIKHLCAKPYEVKCLHERQ